MTKKDLALGTFSKGHSCSQAVLSVFATDLRLDQNTAMKVAAGFGGGMGRTGGTCGAVTGAFMAIGLKYGSPNPQNTEAKEKTYELVREFTREFERRHKSVLCRELLGCDISKPEQMQMAREKKLFITLCPKYVGDAAEILESILASKGVY